MPLPAYGEGLITKTAAEHAKGLCRQFWTPPIPIFAFLFPICSQPIARAEFPQVFELTQFFIFPILSRLS
jgi:hypothetical protein